MPRIWFFLNSVSILIPGLSCYDAVPISLIRFSYIYLFAIQCQAYMSFFIYYLRYQKQQYQSQNPLYLEYLLYTLRYR